MCATSVSVNSGLMSCAKLTAIGQLPSRFVRHRISFPVWSAAAEVLWAREASRGPRPPKPQKGAVAGALRAPRCNWAARARSHGAVSITYCDGSPPSSAWLPWDDSWDERQPYSCAMCAFCASICGIRAGRTPGAAKQPTLNPRVRGSSPWRRTRADLGKYLLRCRAVRALSCGSSCSWPARVAPQRLANAVGSIDHDLGKHVRILGSHADLRVAEDLHDDALVDSLGEQERCRGMPGIVH